MPRKQPVTEQNKKRHRKISYTYWERNLKQTNEQTNKQQSDDANKGEMASVALVVISVVTHITRRGNVAEN